MILEVSYAFIISTLALIDSFSFVWFWLRFVAGTGLDGDVGEEDEDDKTAKTYDND